MNRAQLEAAMGKLLELGRVSPVRCTSEADGALMHHLEAGAGPPLVLLHGAGGGGANWYRVLRSLSVGRRVLAPDLPGFGLSEPLVPRAPLGEQAAGCIAAWLDAVCPERVDIAGTSFGGLVALRLADRLGDRVGRVILLDAVGLGRKLPLRVRLGAVPVIRSVVARPSRAGVRWLLRSLLTAGPHALPPEHAAALEEYLHASAVAGAARVTAAALGHFVTWAGQAEVLTDAELARLAQPVLVLWGARDRFLPVTHGQRAARLLPHAELSIVTGAGHSPNWERPDEVAAAMESFLQGT